jgi:hypothetical protein
VVGIGSGDGMTTVRTNTLVRLEPARLALMQHFLGWQCRLRQLSAREGDGRPTDGMRPELEVDGGRLGRVTVVLNRLPEHALVAELRFTVQRTQEPLERWEAAMRLFQGSYFQQPRLFTDELTALFAPDSSLAAEAQRAAACTLRFAQFNQCYDLPCAVRGLAPDDPLHAATWWHNALFNPRLPPEPVILAFKPDWGAAEAEPSPV